jgi:hypothetical protein
MLSSSFLFEALPGNHTKENLLLGPDDLENLQERIAAVDSRKRNVSSLCCVSPDSDAARIWQPVFSSKPIDSIVDEAFRRSVNRHRDDRRDD